MKFEGDEIRQSDVTFWGAAALLVGAFAVLSVNLGTFVPVNILAGLHATHVQGGSLNQLRAEVAQLREQAISLRNQNDTISSRLRLTEKGQGTVTQRVGAIEASLPGLAELGNTASDLDNFTTAGVGEQETELQIVDGGQMAVVQKPLIGEQAAPTPAEPLQEMPALPTNTTMQQTKPKLKIDDVQTQYDFGIALGPEIPEQRANDAWVEIANKAGPLLLGLGPLLSGDETEAKRKLVAGPIQEYSEAELICARMIRIGITCLPVPFVGSNLPN